MSKYYNVTIKARLFMDWAEQTKSLLKDDIEKHSDWFDSDIDEVESLDIVESRIQMSPQKNKLLLLLKQMRQDVTDLDKKTDVVEDRYENYDDLILEAMEVVKKFD